MIPAEDTIQELRKLLEEQKKLVEQAQKAAEEAQKKAADAEEKAKGFEEDAKKYRALKPLIEYARENYTDLLADVTAGILKH